MGTSDFASLQRLATTVELNRGWSEDSLASKCMLLGEEVGELFQAVRALGYGAVHDGSRTRSAVEDELADVTFVLLTIANRLDVDLGHAIGTKLEKDDHRSWSAASSSLCLWPRESA